MSILPTVVISLISFSMAASCGYIINDIRDVEADRNHAVKKGRVLANGDLSIEWAIKFAMLLCIISLLVSLAVSKWFWCYLIAYLIISLSYTFFLKDIVVLDIFVISSGFLIRVLAGGEAFDVTVSNWIFMTVFMVSLFLAAGKRMGELLSLGSKAHMHRKSLAGYNSSFLEGTLWFSGSAALVTYSLYIIEQRTGLFYTVPLAAFGLLRYIYIVKDGKGDPTEALLKDRQIMGVGIVWFLVICIVTYT